MMLYGEAMLLHSEALREPEASFAALLRSTEETGSALAAQEEQSEAAEAPGGWWSGDAALELQTGGAGRRHAGGQPHSASTIV